MANPQKDPDKRDRKFFFDLNNFDDPDAPEPDAPPPPPIFNQDELEAARTLSYEQGRQKGLNDANTSREQKVAQLVQQISTQFSTLFASEQERESRYEEEVIALTVQSLEKLFPAMNERIGPHEAQQAISRVLKTAGDQSEITIRIHPDFLAEVEAIVAPVRNKDINPPSFHIIGDDTLGPGDCRLHWSDGGAVRDAAQLADGIAAALMALLPEGLPSPSADSVDTLETDDKNSDINEEVHAESPSGESSAENSGETHE